MIDGGFCESCFRPLGAGIGDQEHATIVDAGRHFREEQPTRVEEGGGGRDTILDVNPIRSQPLAGNPGGTRYYDPADDHVDVPDTNGPDPRLAEGAKLIGWLVSFSQDPRGLDYRLCQGRNAIGKNPECEILIDYDERVSGRHAVIVCRGENLTITDDFSQNGTLLNGEHLVGSQPASLKDKDKIRIGRTEFSVYLID